MGNNHGKLNTNRGVLGILISALVVIFAAAFYMAWPGMTPTEDAGKTPPRKIVQLTDQQQQEKIAEIVVSDDQFLTRPGTAGTPTFSNAQSANLRVNWTAPAGGATSYKIARCQGVGCVPTIDIATGVISLFYDDFGLSPNTTYRYLVRATNSAGDGVNSGIGTVVTGSANNAPTAIITDWPPTLIVGRTYTLRGNTSFDPEDCLGGDPAGTCLTYEWSVVTKPLTSAVVFNAPHNATRQFIPDVSGTYAVGLRVRDSAGTWSSFTTSASARTLPKWKETKL
jgi:hypothetical protein